MITDWSIKGERREGNVGNVGKAYMKVIMQCELQGIFVSKNELENRILWDWADWNGWWNIIWKEYHLFLWGFLFLYILILVNKI